MCSECRPYGDVYQADFDLQDPTMDELVGAVEEQLADLQKELTRLKTLRDRGAWVDQVGWDKREGFEYFYTVLDPVVGQEFDMADYDGEPSDQYVHVIQKLDKPIDEGGRCVKEHWFCTRSCRQDALDDPHFMKRIPHHRIADLNEYPCFVCEMCGEERHYEPYEDGYEGDEDFCEEHSAW